MTDIQKSCLYYQGSKLEMLKQHRIHEFIPPTNVNHPYCELFAGSLVMFFNIQNCNTAYINDFDSEIINFWMQLQTNKDEFERKLVYMWNGSPFLKAYEDILKINDTPLNRAVLFYLRNKSGTTYFTKAKYFEKTFDIWKQKMDTTRVCIMNEDFERAMQIVSTMADPTIKSYPRKQPDGSIVQEKRNNYVIFYEDPPYFGSEAMYKTKTFDHIRLREVNQLYAEKGHHIIISYNKCPEILDLYPDWYKEEFCLSDRSRDFRENRYELLLSNRPLQRYTQKYRTVTLTDIFTKKSE